MGSNDVLTVLRSEVEVMKELMKQLESSPENNNKMMAFGIQRTLRNLGLLEEE